VIPRRIVDDEGRLNELVLDGFERLQLQHGGARFGIRFHAFETERGCQRLGIGHLRILGCVLSECLIDREALERLSQLDRVLAVAQLRGPEHGLRERTQHLLGELHEIAVVAVGLVELEHGELGVVARRDPSFLKLRLISYTFSKPPTTRRFR